jgi:hypothetical protein
VVNFYQKIRSFARVELNMAKDSKYFASNKANTGLQKP